MINFDERIERKHTDCTKWDRANPRIKEDTLAMWVADMDFKSPQPILDGLMKRVQHGVFGYTFVSDEYRQAVKDYMLRRHDWKIEKDWIVPLCGIVTAIKVAVNAYSDEGDAIIIQKPVYYPFDQCIELNHRKKVTNPVIFKDGKYSIDFEDFEQKIIEHHVKLYILCNPYNPIGKVWTKEELYRIGMICKKHGVKIISDEIHHDFVYGNHKHIPFYEVDESFKDLAIICTSPSKTFNLAGLQASNIIIKDPDMKERYLETAKRYGVQEPNLLGLEACKIAYTKCDDWLDEMLHYVEENFNYMDQFLKERLPQIHLIKPQGLYLAWVDFRALNMTNEQLETFMLEKANVWLDEGYVFGQEGSGFERFNLACPRSVLKEALERIEKAIKQIK